ncbi:MAG: ABC transporter substrate-binding protein [Actinomycetota bacterium]|nr:ABC transporter substrate-binding protein [Actinomycetota bacterium]
MIRHPRSIGAPSRPSSGTPHQHLRRVATTSVALLASAGLLAACSSSPKPSKAQAKSSTTAAAGPIKIGMITSLTGPYLPLGTNDKLGAEQEVSAINAAGGIDGRQVQLIVENDQTSPTQAIVDYQTLVSDGVVGIVGPVFSSSAMALVPSVQRAKIPTIDTAAADSLVSPTTHYYVFMTPPTTKIVATQLLAYMKAKGLTKMAVARDTSAFPTAGWDNMKALAPSYGVSFVTDQKFSLTATDFTSVLTAVRSSGAQGLMVWGSGPAEVILTKQFRSMGLTIPLLFSHAEASYLYTKTVGAAGYGAIIASSIGGIGPYLPSSYPGRSTITSFASTFQSANGYYPPEFAFDAGGAVAMFAKAIRENGATPAGIAKALQTMTITTGDGTYHFSPTDHSGLTVSQVAITRDVNGTLEPTAFTKSALASAS